MFPTYDEFMRKTPEEMFLFLTSYMAQTLASGHSLAMVEKILSCFEPEARQCLCVGTACVRALGVDPEYRDALKHAMSTVLYEHMKGGKENA